MKKHPLLLILAAVGIAGGSCSAPTAPPFDGFTLSTGEFLVGAVSDHYARDVNRFVPHPLKQVIQLKDHGEYHGFHNGAGHLDTRCDQLKCQEHWQGLARLAQPVSARRYFLAASSHDAESRLAVVDTHYGGGRRLHGNRHSTTKPDWDTPPRREVEIVRSEWMDDHLNHPGGMQVIGQYVAVGMERIDSPAQGKVYLYDAGGMGEANSTPVKRWAVGISGEKVATASIVKLAPLVGETDNRFLLITLGGDSERITFNISRKGKALDDVEVFSTDSVTSEEGSISPTSAGVRGWTNKYQTLQALVDATSQLYLLGANKTSTGGTDYLDLFALRLRLTGGTNAEEKTPLVVARLTHLARKTMYCIASVSGSKSCDFSAAGGALRDRLQLQRQGRRRAVLHSEEIQVPAVRARRSPGRFPGPGRHRLPGHGPLGQQRRQAEVVVGMLHGEG